jgi:hypothetical protein
MSEHEGKILNPDTNRYVLITGKIGRKVLENQKRKKELDSLTLVSPLDLDLSCNSSNYNNFKTIDNRLILKNIINKKLIENDLNSGSFKCLFYNIKQSLDIYNVIGKGSFGIVSLVNFKENPENIPNFALKQTRIRPIRIDITEENMTTIIHEINYLIVRINPLIEKKICPNFPYTYGYYMCNDCSIIKNPYSNKCNFKPDNKKCSVYLTELASGDLSKLNEVLNSASRSDEENIEIIDNHLFNMYFQLMYAVSVLHKHIGILHNDIKKENILYYSIPEGGYYKYIINDEIFYLPNLGYLLILNDFGVSYELYPTNINLYTKNYKFCEFGVINNNKFNITIPTENDSKFGNYTYSKYLKYLKKINIEIDSINSNNYINPIQSYDVMDLIYTFSGGNRCTQGGIRGVHSGLDLFDKSNKFKKRIFRLLEISDKKNLFGHWDKINHYVWRRFQYGKAQDDENGLYISAIHNLLKIFKRKYKNEPHANEIIETYIF